MSEVTDALIAKIQKLMALAEKGGTEEEADAAMAKVQEILTKYNLSMSDVQHARDKDEQFERNVVAFEWNATWIAQVYLGVAELYFCKAWCQPNGTIDQKVVMLGSPVNIYSAMYVAQVIVTNGKRLAKEYAQHAYREYGMNAVSASNNFKKGYASRIRHRCLEMIKDAKRGHVRDAETGTALVVADLYERTSHALDVYTQDVLKVRLRSSVGMRGANDQDAAGAGRTAADAQSLAANGIAQGKGTLLLGGR